jgi:hypothetical protein
MFIRSMPITNYAHNNQSGQWGGNKGIAIARYHKGRLLLMQKLLDTRI